MTEKGIKESEGLCFLASSLSFQQSQIKRDLGHSLYTYYLIEALKGQPGYSDENGNITTDHLYQYVYDKIINESGGLQKPIKKTSIVGSLRVAFNRGLATSKSNGELSSSDRVLRYIEQARNLRNSGIYYDAVDHLNRALNMDPDSTIALKIMGDIHLYDLGKYQEAATYYKKILDKHPREIQVLKDMAYAMKNLSNYEEALKYHKKVLGLNPNDEVAKKEIDIIENTLKSSGGEAEDQAIPVGIDVKGLRASLTPGQRPDLSGSRF